MRFKMKSLVGLILMSFGLLTVLGCGTNPQAETGDEQDDQTCTDGKCDSVSDGESSEFLEGAVLTYWYDVDAIRADYDDYVRAVTEDPENTQGDQWTRPEDGEVVTWDEFYAGSLEEADDYKDEYFQGFVIMGIPSGEYDDELSEGHEVDILIEEVGLWRDPENDFETTMTYDASTTLSYFTDHITADFSRNIPGFRLTVRPAAGGLELDEQELYFQFDTCEFFENTKVCQSVPTLEDEIENDGDGFFSKAELFAGPLSENGQLRTYELNLFISDERLIEHLAEDDSNLDDLSMRRTNHLRRPTTDREWIVRDEYREEPAPHVHALLGVHPADVDMSVEIHGRTDTLTEDLRQRFAFNRDHCTPLEDGGEYCVGIERAWWDD